MVRNTLLLASVSALALLFANDVKAADMAVKAPRYVAPAPVYSWTGCYVGAHVGYGWGRNNHTQGVSSSFSGGFNGVASGRTDTNGGLFGGQVGCNYQFASNWVIGLQGDVAGTNIDGKSNDPFGVIFSEGGSIAVKTDWLASVTGRVGYSFYNNQALLYVKGGGAWVRNTWDLSNSVLFGTFSNSGASTILRETRSGWTVGVGTEWMLTQNWTAFVEFNYYNFGDGKLLNVVNFGDGAGSTFATGKQEIETVKIGVNYKFGFGDAPVVARY